MDTVAHRALVLETNVGDKAQARAAVGRTVAGLGRFDILVNNAGMMLLGSVENASLEAWEQMVHVDLLGLLYTSHAAPP
jgi:NADP-dependent 3-hydroxy acid dehydrogenase YdfG